MNSATFRSPAALLAAGLLPGDALPGAFPQRQALMPMWGARPITPEERDARWADIAARPLAEGSLAYLHIPFCTSRCVFCGFYRNAWQADAGRAYVDRLIAELAHEARLRPPGGSVDAVYFGGGTPTALSAADLTRLLHAVREYLPLAPDCEITVEGRISHFSDDKIEACLAAGATRFSIGIQTFDPHLRRRLGRQHGGDEAAAYLRHLRQYDVTLVADLIFGLPAQDDACWMRDIDVALDLGLDGVDVYAFNCYPSLPINRLIEKGTLPPAQDLASQTRHYAWATRRLLDAGWAQLSNSHFGAPGGRERNRYNSLVKSGRDCAAFGSGAGGQRAGLAYQVNGDLGAYLATPAAQKPFGHSSATSPNKDFFAAIQGQMEKGGLDLALLAGKPAAQALIPVWHAQGLLDTSAGHAGLTLAGRFWAPTMIRALALTLEPYPDAITSRPPHATAAAAPGHAQARIPVSTGGSAPHPRFQVRQGESMKSRESLNDSQRQALRERLARNPAIILEMLAESSQCPLQEVLDCLPEATRQRTGGERFVEIMQAIAAWKTPVTLVVHSADLILEVTAPLPSGYAGHGFYNLKDEGGAHGHLRPQNCGAIYLVERPFMGKPTASLVFLNKAGDTMLKIFAGRDDAGLLLAAQVEAMRGLFAAQACAA